MNSKMTIDISSEGMIVVSIDGKQIGFISKLELKADCNKTMPELVVELPEYGPAWNHAEKIKTALPFAQVTLVPMGENLEKSPNIEE